MPRDSSASGDPARIYRSRTTCSSKIRKAVFENSKSRADCPTLRLSLTPNSIQLNTSELANILTAGLNRAVPPLR